MRPQFEQYPYKGRFMSYITLQPDGLYLDPHATLQELIDESALHEFAKGLIPTALSDLPDHAFTKTMSKILQQVPLWASPLINALMVLDAEIHTATQETRRVLPLTSFLDYRHSLAHINITTLRFPPLNPGGHYYLLTPDAGYSLALRLDIQPQRGVMGHVRLALSSPTRPPMRWLEWEGRLTWQTLTPALIAEACQLPLAEPLTEPEQTALHDLLQQLAQEITSRV